MLIIMSPTKTFREIEEGKTFISSKLSFKEEIEELVTLLQGYTIEGLGKLMKTSDSISEVNYKRYQYFNEEVFKAYPAILYFYGEAFKSLEANTLSEAHLEFAEKHLRILSGLYGSLAPLDVIKEYRLEMGSKILNSRGKDLYSYWKEKLTKHIMKELEVTTGDKVLLNVASEEYSKVLNLKEVEEVYSVINIIFKEKREEGYKVVGTYAKKARGKLIRYVLENEINQVERIKEFNIDGYVFNEELSDEKNIVFSR